MATREEKIAEIEARLARYHAAETRVLLAGQSVSISSRSIDQAQLDSLAKEIRRLEGDLETLLSGNRIKMQRVVPREV
jgi:hypothetical protein